MPKKGKPRVLDFDIENRPLSYLGSDFTTGEITAIAWSWYGEEKVYVRLLGNGGPEGMSTEIMLEDFVSAYDQADIVTGHYIRKHDLPIISGALLEMHQPALGAKLTSDTYFDKLKTKGISASQENLSQMYGLSREKHHMSQVDWREANRLTLEGLRATRKRVVDDVKQHKELRARLIEENALGPPRMWHA